jgi:hypothetical protein
VVDYSPGGGLGVFVSELSLGPPRGAGMLAGSLHVASLGTGGSLTLGFEVTLTDGPGADLVVFENGFFDLGLTGVYSEACFVEVSSDGATFARFPSTYAGPAGPLSPFGTTPVGSYAGLAGARPTLANADANAIDPRDPTAAGGTAFDLADLGRAPEVLAGAVKLSAIRYVRLVDVVDGDLDANDDPIWDNSGISGSADVDAVTALNHTENQDPKRPSVDLSVDEAGRLHVVFEDAQGLGDIVSVDATASLMPIDLDAFLSQFAVADLSQTRTHLVTLYAVTSSGVRTDLTVSVRDAKGRVSADQVTIQG